MEVLTTTDANTPCSLRKETNSAPGSPKGQEAEAKDPIVGEVGGVVDVEEEEGDEMGKGKFQVALIRILFLWKITMYLVLIVILKNDHLLYPSL